MDVARCEHLLYLVSLLFPLWCLCKIRPCSPASFLDFWSSESPLKWIQRRWELIRGGPLASSWCAVEDLSYSFCGKEGRTGCARVFSLVQLCKYPLPDGSVLRRGKLLAQKTRVGEAARWNVHGPGWGQRARFWPWLCHLLLDAYFFLLRLNSSICKVGNNTI